MTQRIVSIEQEDRHHLAPFEGREVVVRGRCVKVADHRNHARPCKVALIEDGEIFVDGRSIEEPHIWVQRIEPLLQESAEGCKVEFTCVIHRYRRADSVRVAYGLRDISACRVHSQAPSVHVPEQIMKVQKPIARPPEALGIQVASVATNGSGVMTPDPFLDILAVLREVKALAKKVGGLGQLKAIIAEMEE